MIPSIHLVMHDPTTGFRHTVVYTGLAEAMARLHAGELAGWGLDIIKIVTSTVKNQLLWERDQQEGTTSAALQEPVEWTRQRALTADGAPRVLARHQCRMTPQHGEATLTLHVDPDTALPLPWPGAATNNPRAPLDLFRIWYGDTPLLAAAASEDAWQLDLMHRIGDLWVPYVVAALSKRLGTRTEVVCP